MADTAVAIMRAFADLGPIGGAIAAAMLTATGVAQVIAANAEREKVKRLQPQKTASSSEASGPATATRVLSGFSEGGYTGDGGRYEVAGLVHRGEYVVPKPIMGNPRVIDAVGTIEAIRQSRRASAGGHTAGFAEGGYTGGAAPGGGSFTAGTSGGADSELSREIRGMLEEMRVIFGNVRAYVSLQDLERKQALLERSRAPFRRNKQ